MSSSPSSPPVAANAEAVTKPDADLSVCGASEVTPAKGKGKGKGKDKGAAPPPPKAKAPPPPKAKAFLAGMVEVKLPPLPPGSELDKPPMDAEAGDAVQITQEGDRKGQFGLVIGANSDRTYSEGWTVTYKVKLQHGGVGWVEGVRKVQADEFDATELKEAWAKERVVSPGPQKRASAQEKAAAAAAREAGRQAKLERQRAEKSARIAHLRSLRPADLDKAPWDQVKDITFMDGGSGGVLVWDLGEEAIALKLQGKTAVSEAMATEIAAACGVRVVRLKIIRGGESGHDQITKAGLARNYPGMPEMIALSFFGDKSLPWCSATDLYGVLEFVPGCPLMGVEGQQALASPQTSLLYSLGTLCAYDVLINNMDRLPMPIWQNDGNLGNVMVTDAGSSITGIDQQVNPISKGPGLERYLSKVEVLVGNLQPGGDPAAIAIDLRQAFELNCGAQISDASLEYVYQGMRDTFAKIAAASRDGSLEKAIEDADQLCIDRFLSEWRWGLVPCLPEEVIEMKAFVKVVGQTIATSIDGSVA